MRRSQRIAENRLKQYYCLPENEYDSENEADQDALSELSENEKVCGAEFDRGSEDDDCEECDADDFECESEEDEPDEDEWSDVTEPMDAITTSFDECAGVIGEVGDNEIDFFSKIWDEAIFNKIVEETNLYAFFGCLIYMGIHKLPSLKCYWSSDPVLRVGVVERVMTLNRFKKMVENLHCNNNEYIFAKSDPRYDKLHKLRPLLDMLNDQLVKVYHPSSYYTVDESMIAFNTKTAAC